MKLSELRPCDSCGGKIAPVFRIVTCDLAAINPSEANRVLGMNQFFGGHALGLAEVFSGRDPVKLASEEAATESLQQRLFLCMDCWCKPICLAELSERQAESAEKKESP